MNIAKNYISICVVALFLQFSFSQSIAVSNISEYKTAIKSVANGGTIILKNGVWKDVELHAYGNGTKENPIIVKAETPGKVIFTGDSQLNIYGTFVTVSGFWFNGVKTSNKHIVEFRKNSKEFANNCRFTNSTISYCTVTDDSIKDHWIDIWGKNNRVDHNNITGKTSAGTTVVVWLKGEEHIENNHLIDHNFFGPRPELGENGGETIRIGTSTNSLKSSKTTVQYNTFKQCNGETEIISNKSGDNIFRGNLFLESEGTLTLRHGNNALVEDNVFLGNNKRRTGGVRIINADHTVRNNLFVGLTGDGLRSPISVMNGVPNSPLNRYSQVKNVDIQNNTIINCGPVTFGAGKSDELSLPPKDVVFANNLLTNTTGKLISEYDDSIRGISFSGNIVDSDAPVDGNFTKTVIDWTMLKSLPMPTENNPILKNVKKTPKSPTQDITNSDRETYVAGAFNLGNTKFPKALVMKTGPGWKPNIVAPAPEPKDLTIAPGNGRLRKAASKARDGDIIKLTEGIYVFDKSLKISGKITILGAEDGGTIIKMKDDIEKPFSYFIRINEGASLTMKNVTIDAQHSRPAKYALVSPDKMQSGLYSIYAENCTFKNFTNTNGGSIYKAYKGTIAENLSFIGCKFLSSYRGLNLSYDKDLGKFSAKSITIDNSVFKDIEEFAVNYIRNTPDTNIPGGKLIVTNSIFDKVANNEKGKILRTNGLHEVTIKNSVFQNSYKANQPINLKGSKNIINNCLFDSAGFPKISKGAKELNLLYKNPKWEDKENYIPSEKSPLLKEKNGIARIGLKQ